eukprot:8637497-Pyramimonas_sp.AAC.1
MAEAADLSGAAAVLLGASAAARDAALKAAAQRAQDDPTRTLDEHIIDEILAMDADVCKKEEHDEDDDPYPGHDGDLVGIMALPVGPSDDAGVDDDDGFIEPYVQHWHQTLSTAILPSIYCIQEPNYLVLETGCLSLVMEYHEDSTAGALRFFHWDNANIDGRWVSVEG